MSDNNEVILSVDSVSKQFPGVLALDDVSFDLRKGEVHALVGENGAGKSTLMHLITGVYAKDAGQIIVNGSQIGHINPIITKKLGISMVYQMPQLVFGLSVAENIFMGRLPKTKFNTIDWATLFSQATQLMSHLDIQVSPKVRIDQISSAQRTMVAIVKALSQKPRIFILDEPTAFLTGAETEKLFSLVSRLTKQGISFIYISHNLEEVFEVADRITVLRNGRKIDTVSSKDVDRTALIKMMTGRDITQQFVRQSFPKGEEALRVEKISSAGEFRDINFVLREGEIVGVFGLIGAGRTEMANALFGLSDHDEGRVIIEGKEVSITSPKEAIESGMGFLTEERKKGLIMSASIKENIVLPIIPKLTRGGIIKRKEEASITHQFVKKLRIVTPGINQKIKFLSGGNQQKAMLAKWLASNAKIMVFDEPTNGVDVGARRDIYELMNDLTRKGMGIILISSDLDEVLGMSDRILVMRAGSIVARFKRGEVEKRDVLETAFH